MGTVLEERRTLAGGAPNRQDARRREWLVWVIFLAAVLLICNRPWQASRPPAASTLGDSDFSATRAFAHVDMLATKLGRRVTGTEVCVRAADYIENRLRSLGVETERQVASGSMELDGTTYVYRGVQNVLGRIGNRGTPAVLVSVHYDSGAEGPGAGDNALNVAVVLEIVRAIRVGPAPKTTIIFNFNGGEELGLLGAAGFVRHPWFRDVAAFINLDASGPSGRQLLLQVAPGRDNLLETYAATAPYVHGTVLAQEIFQMLPLDTDYHIYHRAGLQGIDLAPYGDGYAYHTPLDRTERVSQRTLHESGANLLALLRGLKPLSIPAEQDVRPRTTYYDLLGLVMMRYSARAAQVAGALIAALALILVCRRRAFGMLALGVASVTTSLLLALLMPILAGIFVMFSGKSMFWFARPFIGVGVYGAFATMGGFSGYDLVRALAYSRGLTADVVAQAMRRGLVVFWAVLLLLTTALGLGSAYLPLWWCAGSAVTLLASTHLDGAWRWFVTLAGVSLAAVTTVQASTLILTAMAPISGTLGTGVPADLVIAGIIALSVAPFALLLAPELRPAQSLRRAGAGFVGVMVVIVALVACSFPYTPERPKRAYVDVRAGGKGGPYAVVEATDSGPDFAVKYAALNAPVTRPLPTSEVSNSTSPQSSESHTVEICLKAEGAYRVDVQLDGPMRSWSTNDGRGSAKGFVWIGTHDPLTFRLEKTSGARVVLHLKAYYLGSDVPVEQVLARLPRWAAPSVQTVIEIDDTI